MLPLSNLQIICEKRRIEFHFKANFAISDEVFPQHTIDFFGNFGKAAKDATLGALTGTAPATEIGQYKSANYRPSSPGKIPDNNPIGLTEEYFRSAPRAEARQVANAGRYDAEVITGAKIRIENGLIIPPVKKSKQPNCRVSKSKKEKALTLVIDLFFLSSK